MERFFVLFWYFFELIGPSSGLLWCLVQLQSDYGLCWNMRDRLTLILFIYLFLAVLGLHFCARAFSICSEGGHSSSRCADLSLSWPLLLRSIGSRCAGSVVVAHGPSCSAACGIFPDQGSNPCPLHWQAHSQPLHHQGNPRDSLTDESVP